MYIGPVPHPARFVGSVSLGKMSTETEKQSDETASHIPGLNDAERKKAAISIQKTFRGHRTRRELEGHTLDPTTRWTEAIRDAQFREATAVQRPSHPQPHSSSLTSGPESGRPTPARADDDPEVQKGQASPARKQWQRVGQIAMRAGADDPVDSESENTASESDTFGHPQHPLSSEEHDHSKSEEGKMAQRQRRAQARNDRKKAAKMMDLQYFLEMVDHKHRYGSNLRQYHNRWKSEPTTQNFFYWLDYGQGKDLELPGCSRERLNREQVRYLSREERLGYLVKVDKDGRLLWAKSGERISTDDEEYRDSIHGVVHKDSSEPRFRDNRETGEMEAESASPSDSSEEDEHSEAEPYTDEFSKAKGPSKLAHVSPAVIFNQLIRTSVKKGNKWIFVADTSFRLYVGIKESGAFQHSSFLHGARISAAGLIRIKDGQLRTLQPRSGHYRPPAANFRAFVHSLRDEGVDMSRVSISKSYAVLVGIEGYTKTRKKIKEAEQDMKHTAEKVTNPQKAKEEEERQKDKSKSAEKERMWLEHKQAEERKKVEEDKRRKREGSFTARLMQKLHLRGSNNSVGLKGASRGAADGDISTHEKSETATAETRDPTSSHQQSEMSPPSPSPVPGPGPEDGVPPPEGTR